MKIKHILVIILAGFYISGCDVSDSVATNTADTVKIRIWSRDIGDTSEAKHIDEIQPPVLISPEKGRLFNRIKK